LSLNSMTFRGKLATAASGFNFRFVFELWFFDETTNKLVFTWTTMNTQHSVWAQIWFNVTTTH
jgi:hypothetical protein